MSTFMLKSIKIKENILKDPFYKHLFSVEVVNELVLQGMPFRDAYKQVGTDIEQGNFAPDQTKLNHSHEGSIGNLSLDAIEAKMNKVVISFDFEKIDLAVSRLLN